MRRQVRRRPVVESLESLTLLSALATTATHAVAAEVSARPTNVGPIELVGTAKGVYRNGQAAGAPISFVARGNISPLGRSTIRGNFQATVSPPTGSVTFSEGRRGEVTATLAATEDPSIVTYTITGGKGRFASATGSGTATISFAKANARGLGSYSTTFHPA